MRNRFIMAGVAILVAAAQCDAAPESGKATANLGDGAQLLSIRAKVRVGDSYESIKSVIGLSEVEAGDVLAKHPFTRQFGFVKPRAAAVWTDGVTRPNGRPGYYIAHFEGPTRTNLVDLFYVRDGTRLVLTNGRFEQKLRSVARGMNMQDVYKDLGEEQCSYYQADDKKWRVRFTYRGYKGSFIGIEADAASGVVVSARDGTI